MAPFPEVMLSQIWEATDLQERGLHSAELFKTIVHQHRQLVHRLSSLTPTDQIEQLDEGMSQSAGDQQTSKNPTTLEQRAVVMRTCRVNAGH